MPALLRGVRVASAAMLVAVCTWSLAIAQETPRRGGTFIQVVGAEPSSLVGIISSDSPDQMVAAQVFSGLLDQDALGKLIPDLAEKWEVSPDGLTLTFQLNPNAKFHDGVPVTAEDAAFTIGQILPTNHPRGPSWAGNLEYARADGPHTLVIKLKNPAPWFLGFIGAHRGVSGAYIMPKHLYAGTDIRRNPKNNAPIGSGPFKFVAWQRGSHVEMERNPNYFKPNLPYLDRMIVQIMPDASARMIALQSKQVDYISATDTPLEQVPALKDAKFQLVDQSANVFACVQMMLVNVRGNKDSNKPLADQRVRQALAYALNRDEINDKSGLGFGEVARSILSSRPPVGWAFTGEYDVYKRDVERANRMLDEAGFRRAANGTRFALRIDKTSGREIEVRSWDIMRDQLRAVGIELRPQILDRPAFVDKVFTNWDFDLAMQQFCGGPDPDIGIASRIDSRFKDNKLPFANGMGYGNAAVDALIDAEGKMVAEADRRKAWGEIQKILMNDLPMLPLYISPNMAVAADYVRGVNGPGPRTDISSRELTWLAK
jgi:peptide/nickel transport system substrate-binding protein